jgi:hypothetical protein
LRAPTIGDVMRGCASTQASATYAFELYETPGAPTDSFNRVSVSNHRASDITNAVKL